MYLPDKEIIKTLTKMGATLPNGWEPRWNECYEWYKNVRGWFSNEEAFTLWALAQQAGPGEILEIGSYTGRSTLVLAHAAIATNRSVFAVDTFEGTSNMVVPRYAFFDDKTKAIDGVQLLTAYRTNTWKPHLRDIINTMIGKSEFWSKYLQANFHLAFIDGEHVFEFVVKDIKGWLPMVLPGGFAAFHDYSHNVGVERAIDETVPWDQWERLEVIGSTLVARKKQ